MKKTIQKLKKQDNQIISNKTYFALAISLWLTTSSLALEPDQILVIANQNQAESMQIAQHYCQLRNINADNIFLLPLSGTSDSISRAGYQTQIAAPIRKYLKQHDNIKCLVTTRGIPTKVGKRSPLMGKEKDKTKITDLIAKLKNQIQLLDLNPDLKQTPDNKKQLALLKKKQKLLQNQLDWINGKATSASLDSELSMVKFTKPYSLHRWQPNFLHYPNHPKSSDIIMVSRLDGPTAEIAKALVNKAIEAEKKGLRGNIYIDTRGMVSSKAPHSFGYYDQSLRDFAEMAKRSTTMKVVIEKTSKLFQPGDCPQTALYCGWYSLENYIDAFDFSVGAVGFHIASFEAIDLRDPNSPQWCPAMLKDGITATIGAVAEPYLSSFVNPKDFFEQLIQGKTLVEAYYLTNPFNSWQMMLIGDPLYRPFKSIAPKN